MRLTKAAVERAKYTGTGNARCVLLDDETPGFALRIYPSGRKSFILRYRTGDGNERLLTIGDFPTLTVIEARTRAARLRGAILDGADPNVDKERRRQGSTVADLITAYLERHARPHKKTAAKDEQRLNRHIKKKWGNRRADSITVDEVSRLHHDIGKNAPVEANRVVEIIRKMFHLARAWGFVPKDFENPAVGIVRFKEAKRDRWVTHEELPTLVTEIDKQKSVYIRAALWLYILTGVRKSELLGAKWEDYDPTRRELRIPDTKAGRPHIVPLSGQAVAILESVPVYKENPHIFPGRRTNAHLVNIDKTWGEIRKAAKLDDVRLHDLRRTVGSWLAMDGTSLLVIGKTLNQTTPSTTQVYARLSEDPVRAALERHGAKVDAVIKAKQAEVSQHPAAKEA